MSTDPDQYRLAVSAEIPLSGGGLSRAERVRRTEADMAHCLAGCIFDMNKYSSPYVNDNGADCLSLELFVFTREEITELLAAAARVGGAPGSPSVATGGTASEVGKP